MPSWTLSANRSSKSKLELVSVDVFTADDTRHKHSVTSPQKAANPKRTEAGANQYLSFLLVEWWMIDNNWCFHHEQRPTGALCNLQVSLYVIFLSHNSHDAFRNTFYTWKAANLYISEAGTSSYLAFMLDKWLTCMYVCLSSPLTTTYANVVDKKWCNSANFCVFCSYSCSKMMLSWTLSLWWWQKRSKIIQQ